MNLSWATICVCLTLTGKVQAGQHVFTVNGDRCLLNDDQSKVIGLRCSMVMISDEASEDLISQLPVYRSYGLNAVSVYWMGVSKLVHDSLLMVFTLTCIAGCGGTSDQGDCATLGNLRS